MKPIYALFLVLGLLVAGCTKPPAQTPPAQPPPVQPPPAQNVSPPPSCSEYCMSLPHTQCDGEWKISGTYPNCVCNYECKTVTPPPQNQTPPLVPPPPSGPGPLTDSLGQLLDSGLSRAEQRFNAKGLEGDFEVLNLRWVMTPETNTFNGLNSSDFAQAPDNIPLTPNDLRASSIRFNSMYIDGLRGFALSDSVPTGDTAPHYLLGTMVFIESSAPVDGFASGGTQFTIQYDPHPELSQVMEGCKVLSSEEALTPSGTKTFIYDFECKLIYGAN